jgi:hypothetical protein
MTLVANPCATELGAVEILGEVEVKNDLGAALPVAVTDGVDTAAVNARTDGVVALEVADDFTSFEASHQTLVASTDTTITFAQTVRAVQVTNWDTAARVLVKDGAIGSDIDAASARVGKAAAADVPSEVLFPIKTGSIHLRSAAASEVTVVGFF